MIKKYPYRFKTIKEFISTFGDNWEHEIQINGPNWNCDMNYLFGKEFPFTLDELNSEESEYPINGRWEDRLSYGIKVSWCMIIDNKSKVPSYKPRKFKKEI